MEIKLNKTEIKALIVVKNTGFIFYGDSVFTTFNQAKRCIDGLVRKGMLSEKEDGYGKSFIAA